MITTLFFSFLAALVVGFLLGAGNMLVAFIRGVEMTKLFVIHLIAIVFCFIGFWGGLITGVIWIVAEFNK